MYKHRRDNLVVVLLQKFKRIYCCHAVCRFNANPDLQTAAATAGIFRTCFIIPDYITTIFVKP